MTMDELGPVVKISVNPYLVDFHARQGAWFVARVTKLLQAQGLEPAELAHRIGVSPLTVALFLSQRHRPQHSTVERIALALGVELAEIWYPPEIHWDQSIGVLTVFPRGTGYQFSIQESGHWVFEHARDRDGNDIPVAHPVSLPALLTRWAERSGL
jgi:transcriptional regulator with XRE-family HTH domain